MRSQPFYLSLRTRHEQRALPRSGAASSSEDLELLKRRALIFRIPKADKPEI